MASEPEMSALVDRIEQEIARRRHAEDLYSQSMDWVSDAQARIGVLERQVGFLANVRALADGTLTFGVMLAEDEVLLLEMLALLTAAKAKMDADAERAAVVGAELLGVKR